MSGLLFVYALSVVTNDQPTATADWETSRRLVRCGLDVRTLAHCGFDVRRTLRSQGHKGMIGGNRRRVQSSAHLTVSIVSLSSYFDDPRRPHCSAVFVSICHSVPTPWPSCCHPVNTQHMLDPQSDHSRITYLRLLMCPADSIKLTSSMTSSRA